MTSVVWGPRSSPRRDSFWLLPPVLTGDPVAVLPGDERAHVGFGVVARPVAPPHDGADADGAAGRIARHKHGRVVAGHLLDRHLELELERRERQQVCVELGDQLPHVVLQRRFDRDRHVHLPSVPQRSYGDVSFIQPRAGRTARLAASGGANSFYLT